MTFTIELLRIPSLDEPSASIVADFYKPIGMNNPPVIIMGHGFAAERCFKLPPFAKAFAEAGYAVVLFDYRGFGDSTGSIRELVSAPHHLQDFKSVLQHVKARNDVNTQHIILWGSSYGGGHVLVTAAREVGIKAVIAQVPHVDGVASSMLFPKSLLPKAMWMATRDIIAQVMGNKPPVRVPVIAQQGLRCLAGADCYAGYKSMVTSDTWTGLVPARILLSIGLYRPTTEVANINCPTLVIAANQDSLIPISATKKAVQKIKQCQFEAWDMGHFDLYSGAGFDKNLARQLAFLKQLT